MSTPPNSPRDTSRVEITPIDNNAPADGSSTNSLRARIIGANDLPLLDQQYPINLQVSGAAIFPDTGDKNITAFANTGDSGYTAPVVLTDTVPESVVVSGSVFFPVGVQPAVQALNFSPVSTYQFIFDTVVGNGLTLSPTPLNLRVRILRNGQPFNGDVGFTVTNDVYELDRSRPAVNTADPIVLFPTNQKYFDTQAIDGYASASIYSTSNGAIGAIKVQPKDSNSSGYQLVAFATPAGSTYTMRATGPTLPTPANGASQCVVTASAFQSGNTYSTGPNTPLIYFWGLRSDQAEITWSTVSTPQITSKITATSRKPEQSQVMFLLWGGPSSFPSGILAWLPYTLDFS